jgi:hypothetical protein
MGESWIVIHNWPEHQHYRDRDPIWIKDYLSQMSDDRYRRLSFHLRGVLQSLRLAYASSNGRLTTDTRHLSRQLGHRVMTRDLVSLSDAGLIHIVASRPLALTRSREKRREEKKGFASAKTSKPATTAASPAVNMPPRDKVAEARALVKNGAITDPYELDILDIPDTLRDELRALL